jgi:c-di-GMP-binding flagellar brake protein YcgR
LEDDKIETREKTPFIDVITRDLSGGGICMAVKEKVDTAKPIECQLQLPESILIKFTGKAVRLSCVDNKGTYKYEVGIEFMEIDNKCRESIIGFIFQEQRKLRKKGLV